MLPRHSQLRALRAFVLALVGLVFVASWPGAALRAIAVELVAPAVPKEITGRDGILDVVVRAKDTDDGPARDALAGARVRAFAILDGRAHAAGEAEADADGRATLRDLPQAEHWIVAEAPGRARASQMVVVVAGARRLDLELAPEHTLDVVVKEEAGAPMIGAEIEVRGPDPFPVGARTGDGGRARVGRLGEGPYTVTVRAPGFEEVTRRRVPEGQPLVVVLGKQGALLVEVVGADGAPAPSSRVLVGSPGLGATRVAETGKDGKVRIAGLDGGSYALRAVNGSRVSPIELGIILARGEERPVRLALAPGVTITAHVVDAATDEDVRDARVTLAEGGLSPFPSDGVTDKRGRVVLGPIAPGPATLSGRAEGFVPKAAMALDAEASSEVKIALARGGALIGKVSDARGYAVDGATIRVVGTDLDGMPIDEDPSRWSFREAHFTAQLKGPSPLVPAGELGVMPGPVPAIPHGPLVGLSFGGSPPPGAPASSASADPWVTGRDGMFRATPITPGRVRALVRHPQYVEALSEIVVLESNKEARVDVVLQRGGSLEGRVVDARGRPVSGAHVTALATRGSLERMTRSGTDGSFAFAALPDAVTILVARDEDVTTIVARVEVLVPEAGKKTIEITLPEPRPALPVKVTDARGSGIEAAQISAVSLDPSEVLRVTAFSDPRGRAELAGARGIAARVEVRAPGRAARVVVTTPETPELVVALVPAESVTGEVVTRRREPLSGAEVTLQTEAGVRHARTNKDGAFVFGDVAPGPARLRVRMPGRAPEERAIVVEDRAGRRATEVPRFELADEGVVEGVVVDGRGEPIPGARVAKDAVPTYLPVGAAPTGMAVTDGKGRFRLGELGEGTLVLEAYAADVGRARRTDVLVRAGRTTSDVKLVVARGEAAPKEPIATGGVAITLGETAAGLEAPEVVVVAVSEGSEAERGGLVTGDVVIEVGGVKVASIAEARARLSGPVHDDVLVRVRRGERVVALRIAREAVRR
ncbi:MAG: carboxypeptidase regulatory-like domain-containing protein [Labilithrix sp.]|nr:carboxypeptidase regulatory-like domain-containing protein [Labilithrix sp.]